MFQEEAPRPQHRKGTMLEREPKSFGLQNLQDHVGLAYLAHGPEIPGAAPAAGTAAPIAATTVAMPNCPNTPAQGVPK